MNLTKQIMWTTDDMAFNDMTFIWNMSHTVNIWIDGHNVDCFTFYDGNGNVPSVEKVEELIKDYLCTYV